MAAARRADDFPPDIEDLDEYTESINIMCHADTGAGKTVLWSRLPNVLILAVEEGAVSAKRWERDHPRPRNAGIIKVWKINHWDKLVEAYEYLRDNDHPFEWVLIDSITKAQTRCLSGIMEHVIAQNKTRDPDIPAIQDHFKWQLMMKRMVTDFNELPVNVVWLARSMVKEDPEGEDIVVPLIEGKDYQISAWVCGEVHLLCYLKKVKKGKSMVRKLYTNEHALYWCKDRYNVLPPIISNPDANKIVRAITDSGAAPEVGRPASKKPVAKRAAGKSGTRKRAASK